MIALVDVLRLPGVGGLLCVHVCWHYIIFFHTANDVCHSSFPVVHIGGLLHHSDWYGVELVNLTELSSCWSGYKDMSLIRPDALAFVSPPPRTNLSFQGRKWSIKS